MKPEEFTIFKEATLEKSAAGSRTFKFVASDESEDRDGDIVRAAGWDLSDFKKNPIILYGHNHMMPIGYSPSTKVESKRLVSDIKLAAEGTSEFIDTLAKLMDQKIVRAVSVGFRATKAPSMRRDEENDRIIGFEFNGQKLLEISVVAVPSNANALEMAKGYGLSERMMTRLFAPGDAIVQSAKRQRIITLKKLGASS